MESAATAKILAHWLTTGMPLVVLSPVLGLLLNLPAPGYGALVTFAAYRDTGAFPAWVRSGQLSPLDQARRTDPCTDRAAADHARLIFGAGP